MSPDGSIHATHVWKRFRNSRSRLLLRDQLAGLAARVGGRIGPGWRWALQDLNIGIEPGESVGLVGPNGSGKSTLLKLLTRVMYPYAGQVAVSGRVGALIEVRAGIHGDLSGRDNIYLYGSLLGLGRKGVARRFDEIVGFAELEDAVDRQVKFYSSGMQMRLGFGVAAFLEPDVLLVDEVLAVGDASFQQKCLDRMREVLAQGTTLVLVSHDLAAVEATCARGIWLNNGVIEADGPVRDVMTGYRHAIEERIVLRTDSAGPVRVLKAEVTGADDAHLRTQAPCRITVVVEAEETILARAFVGITEGPATPVFVISRDLHLSAGHTQIGCLLPRLPLPRGAYYLWIAIRGRESELLPWQPAAEVHVSGPLLDEAPPAVVRLAPVHVEATWEIDKW